MDRMKQFIAEIKYNIETQTYMNPVWRDWYNYTNCFDYHKVKKSKNSKQKIKITANNMFILVLYENDTILKIINSTKKYLPDMSINRDIITKPYCYKLAIFIIIPSQSDILYYNKINLNTDMSEY